MGVTAAGALFETIQDRDVGVVFRPPGDVMNGTMEALAQSAKNKSSYCSCVYNPTLYAKSACGKGRCG